MKNSDLLKIAKSYGDPVYVYDSAKIISQFNRLTKAFGSVKNLKLNYAAKALSNITILRLMNSLGSGLDTVSIQEVQLGLLAGFKPESIIFTPNGVSLEEIEEAAKLGVRINIDNLSILEQFGSKHPDIPVCIRINPHVMAGGNSNISVGHIDSKFGISIHQIPHLLRIVELTQMNINGIHMHTGSDILDIDVFLYASEKQLRIEQRKMSRKYKKNVKVENQSKGWHKQKKIVAQIHEKVKNQRTTFLHQLSAKLIKENDTICIEDLNVAGMVKNHKLAKRISDTSWSEFTRQLNYKADWQGKNIIKID